MYFVYFVVLSVQGQEMSQPVVVIVGAGVTGLSAAYHLARRKHARVTVLEQGVVGDGSSTRAAGIITGLLWNRTAVEARTRCLELFRQLSRDLEGYTFHDVGTLNIYTPESWQPHERMLPLYDELNVPYEVLTAAEIRQRWPDLVVREGDLGLLDPRAGYSEPDEYIPAIAREACRLGVELQEHTTVTDLIVRDDRIAGVRTSNGDVAADAVVIATHAWTNLILNRVGAAIPTKNFVHQRYVTSPWSHTPRVPAVNADPYRGYARPAKGNRLLVGIETADRQEHRVTSPSFRMHELTADHAKLRRQLEIDFTPLIPGLAGSRWESERTGLICFSLDNEPILGPLDEVAGLYLGGSFHSGGFAYNPVAGELLAEYVSGGPLSVDAAAFLPSRFHREETDTWLATEVSQSAAARRRH